MTGQGLTVDGGHLTVITAVLTLVIVIAGFAAIRLSLTFPSFGPTRFAVTGSPGRTALPGPPSPRSGLSRRLRRRWPGHLPDQDSHLRPPLNRTGPGLAAAAVRASADLAMMNPGRRIGGTCGGPRRLPDHHADGGQGRRPARRGRGGRPADRRRRHDPDARLHQRQPPGSRPGRTIVLALRDAFLASPVPSPTVRSTIVQARRTASRVTIRSCSE